MKAFVVGILVGMIFQAVVIETFVTAVAMYERPAYPWEKP